jgi:hypothetical protein
VDPVGCRASRRIFDWVGQPRACQILRADDETEWFVPVTWLKTVPREQAIKFKGGYGNQNSATKLTDAFTRETVLDQLGVADNKPDVETDQAAAIPSVQ